MSMMSFCAPSAELLLSSVSAFRFRSKCLVELLSENEDGEVKTQRDGADILTRIQEAIATNFWQSTVMLLKMEHCLSVRKPLKDMAKRT